MATQAQLATEPKIDAVIEQKVQKLWELFADAPELGRVALERRLAGLKRERPAASKAVQTAGRIGARQGKVSEFTLIFPFAKGGAERLRAILQLRNGDFELAVHDMRFVFLDNDTKLLFATAYDGDWGAYIDDFVTKIPDDMDMICSAIEGYPGLRSPTVKDGIVKHAEVAAEGWYVAHPDLTVAEIHRLKRIGKAVTSCSTRLDSCSGQSFALVPGPNCSGPHERMLPCCP
jgi:hypothetical protein